MEWFKSGAGQLIALVTIIGTLAGFGYTGATYVNRLENLERKVSTVSETEDAQQDIEERFSRIETSVDYINKSIDEGINISLRTQASSINSLKAQIEGMAVAIDILEEDAKKLEDSSNPLAN